MIMRGFLGDFGNAGADAYNAVINSGGSIAQAEAASRSASASQTTTSTSPVVTAAPQPIIQNTADPYPAQVLQPAQPAHPTRQTIQPVTSNADPTSPIKSNTDPMYSLGPLPPVTQTTDSAQYSLVPLPAGAGAQVPDEYQTQDVVATQTAPVVTSASIPWGLLLSLAGAAYESFKK